VLESFGTRIRRRIDDLAVYRDILDKAIQSLQTDISQYEHKDLDTMLAFIKFAQAGEDNDVEIWRQIDAERQSTLITVERLQKLVGPKKKINQRNKKQEQSFEEEGGTKGEGGTRRGGGGGAHRSSGMSRQWTRAAAIHCLPQCSGSTYYGWSQGLEITMSQVAQWVC
jgi:hypothetical protein